MHGCADSMHGLYCTQGAELMSKFGINVPPGKSAHSLDDVKKAAEAMKDENNEVHSWQYGLDPDARFALHRKPFLWGQTVPAQACVLAPPCPTADARLMWDEDVSRLRVIWHQHSSCSLVTQQVFKVASSTTGTPW